MTTTRPLHRMGRLPRALSALALGASGLSLAALVAQAAPAGASSPNTSLPATTTPAPVQPQALILATSVWPYTATDGSAASLEAQQAEADGFAVTVVDAATWDAMTAADFARYSVLIIGDPLCGGPEGYAAAQANANVWEPVVMASGGNKVLIGTDATAHNDGPYGTQRGDLLERDGIAFAGASEGGTGVYIDTSCTFSNSAPPYVAAPPGTPVPIMDGLSTHGAHQFTAGGAPCAGAISIVAASGPTASLRDADLSNWNCSVHAFFDHYPSDWTPLALATDPGIPKVYSAKDVDSGAIVAGSPYILISGGGVTISSHIALAPATGLDWVGGRHTVTATVTINGTPAVGQDVTFDIDAGPNVGQTGSGVTDAAGQASFTYTDSGGAGTDSISATFVDPLGAQEKATATETWISANPTPGSPTPNLGFGLITASGVPIAPTEGSSFSGTVATVSDPDPASVPSEYDAVISWGDGTSSFGTITGTGGAFSVSGSHTYAEEGTDPVTVTVVDITSDNNTATVQAPATVADAALAATGTTITTTNPLGATVARFTDADPNGTVGDYTATVDWGDGTTSAGTVGAGATGFVVKGTHSYADLGPYTVKTHICDVGGSCADAVTQVLVYALPAPGTAFVTGNGNGTTGGPVTFWGAQWWKANTLTGGRAPASFKGYADNVASLTCGGTWATRPGNSSHPPAAVPSYMAAIVSSSITQSGSTISGDIAHVVIVHTAPGYAPSPGHAGTGTVVATIC